MLETWEKGHLTTNFLSIDNPTAPNIIPSPIQQKPREIFSGFTEQTHYFFFIKIFFTFATRSREISMFTAIPIITPIAVSKIRFSG